MPFRSVAFFDSLYGVALCNFFLFTAEKGHNKTSAAEYRNRKNTNQ